MRSTVPLGYVLARLSLAGLGIALLVSPLRLTCSGATVLASGPAAAAAASRDAAASGYRWPGPAEPRLIQMPRGVHPIGLSGDGQPHDTLHRRVPAPFPAARQ